MAPNDERAAYKRQATVLVRKDLLTNESRNLLGRIFLVQCNVLRILYHLTAYCRYFTFNEYLPNYKLSSSEASIDKIGKIGTFLSF